MGASRGVPPLGLRARHARTIAAAGCLVEPADNLSRATPETHEMQVPMYLSRLATVTGSASTVASLGAQGEVRP